MSKVGRKSVSKDIAGGDELTALRKMARLLEVLVRLNLETMRGNRSQADIISVLDSVGCRQSEIADLLGTTSNTVNVALYKAKKKKIVET